MSHRGHCEARRPGSKGHFLHRGGGATGSATCPFAQLGKVYKRVAGMLCGELVIPQYRSSVFLYRGRFEQRNVLEWVPKFSPQIRWQYMSLTSPDLDLETCQHFVILWAGQLKTYPLWLFKDTSLRFGQFLVIHRLWFLRCIAKSAPPKKWDQEGEIPVRNMMCIWWPQFGRFLGDAGPDMEWTRWLPEKWILDWPLLSLLASY